MSDLVKGGLWGLGLSMAFSIGALVWGLWSDRHLNRPHPVRWSA